MTDPTSISLNYDIMDIVEGKQKYIQPEVTKLDPEIFPSQKRDNLTVIVNKFLESKTEQVFALLG